MIVIESVRLDTGTSWFEQFEQGISSITFVLVNYGKCVYWIEGDKVVLEKGDLLLIPAATAYYGKCIPTVTHEKHVVTFRTNGSQADLSLPVLETAEYLKWATGKYELLLQRFRAIHEEWNERRTYRESMCGALTQEILTYFNRELDEGRPSLVRERHVSLMKAYIQNHYREKVTKEELGAVICKTPNYAATVFSEVTGQTIGGFVHAQRIKTAIYLLSHSQRTVGDISDYLGYCDPSYFHRIFKRETGKPPALYMKDRDIPVH